MEVFLLEISYGSDIMTELEVINSTRYPKTRETLYVDFRKLGIHPGDVILVHSSLSSIGWVCGGAIAVIQALLEAVGDTGTICMPAHSGDNSDPAQWENPPVPKEWVQEICKSMPAFNPLITPALYMGKIAESFRTFPNTLRSNHPQGSFCASGKYAEDIVKSHPLTPQFGEKSPLGQLLKLDAKILLLGVGYDNCTSFHMAETLLDKMPKKRTGASVEENGERKWIWFDDCDYDPSDFEKIGGNYEKLYNVNTGKVGNANCKLFNMKSAVDFSIQWMKNNRFAYPEK